MRQVRGIEFEAGSREEKLPGFDPGFPYIATRAELDSYPGRAVPWHWHRAVELFYMESGTLEYSTPQGQAVFPPGTGGFVNAGVLHATRVASRAGESIQLVHLFDPALVAGAPGGRIERKYVLPLTSAPQVELLALRPDVPQQARALALLRAAFDLREGESGYELRLRGALSSLWLELFGLAQPLLAQPAPTGGRDGRIKSLLAYIHEHYPEPVTVAQLAAAAYLSERACFRLFRDCLHMSPAEYLRSYRLQMACQMLAHSDAPVAEVARGCGLGDTSYFGRVFRAALGCTPTAYRQKWQDRTIKRRE